MTVDHLVRSADKRTVTHSRANALPEAEPLLLTAIFATRWGPVFDDTSLKNGWVYIDRSRVYGPWLTPEAEKRGDVYYVLAAKLHPANTLLQPVVVTDRADPTGIDWEIKAPPLVMGASTPPSSGAKSVSTLTADMYDGWITTVGRLSGTLWANILAMPGEVWMQEQWYSESQPEGPTPQADRKWVVSTHQYWPSDVAYRRASYIRPDGTTYAQDAAGVQGRLHRLAYATSADDAVPSAPSITSHTSPASVMTDEMWTVAWTDRPGLSGPQASIAVKVVRADGATQHWNAALQMFQTAPVGFPWTAKQITIPAGAIPRGTHWSLQVATAGVMGGLGPWSAAVQMDSSYAPSASVLVVGRDSATGNVPELAPTVVVSGTATRGVIERSEVVVKTAAGVTVAQTSETGPATWRGGARGGGGSRPGPTRGAST